MDKTSSRRYPVTVGNLTITQPQLELIRSNANQILIASAGSDNVSAIVHATIMHLVHAKLLTIDPVKA
jgi:hypothetical protein